MSQISQSAQRIDALGKVTGSTLYPGDINYPDQVYMKILFANRPHAIVKDIDTQAAESVDGVIAALLQKMYRQRVWFGIKDQPVLCGSPNKPFTDQTGLSGSGGRLWQRLKLPPKLVK
jgi:CO/xanthine dehydrogenase Mo-binding subunit